MTLAPDPSADVADDPFFASLTAMVRDPDYPCLGARSVYNRGRATMRGFSELGTAAAADALRPELRRFARDTDIASGFASFVAVFAGPQIPDERTFERLLWRQLQHLHDGDRVGWAPGVSRDPGDPHFGFSVGGTAYFVVGLHPQASRLARRAAHPTLVFNLHQQFDDLRRSEGYLRMRDTIRRRDRRLQGTVNPMVADHGTVSEARQYAGRRVGEQWRAPFTP